MTHIFRCSTEKLSESNCSIVLLFDFLDENRVFSHFRRRALFYNILNPIPQRCRPFLQHTENKVFFDQGEPARDPRVEKRFWVSKEAGVLDSAHGVYPECHRGVLLARTVMGWWLARGLEKALRFDQGRVSGRVEKR